MLVHNANTKTMHNCDFQRVRLVIIVINIIEIPASADFVNFVLLIHICISCWCCVFTYIAHKSE